MKKNITVWVVWAWASWMMCVAQLLEWWFDWKIILFEKNNWIWKKVLITWWWRCNLTNNVFDIKTIFWKYVHWSKFLTSTIRSFSPKKTMEFFENHWVLLKTEKYWRVFPISNKSLDIVNVFLNIFDKYKNIQLNLNEEIISFEKKNNVFFVYSKSKKYQFDILVVSTWWQFNIDSFPFFDLRRYWHNIIPLKPWLSSLIVKEKNVSKMQWISFEQVWISFSLDWKIKKIIWPIIFTDFGISWPVVFELSSNISYKIYSYNRPFEIQLKFFIDKDFLFWESFFLDCVNKNKTIKNILRKYFSSKFLDIFLFDFVWLSFDIKLNSLTKDFRKKISHFLWDWIKINIIWNKKWSEFVMVWWIDTNEINKKTMESKKIDWLYFSWEVMNVDWVTWWYNLQACWSTGTSVAKKILQNKK